MTNCKNCNSKFDGKYCPECGQKAKTNRITFRQVVKDVREHFIHFDQGFLYTIRELALRPGHTIREYLAGKRVKHVKPLKFMVWATAISFFVTHLLGYQELLIQRIEAEKGTTEQSHQMGQKIIDFVTTHPSLLMFFIVPMVALSSWVLFRKKQYNYAEYFTMNAFLMGQLSLLSIFTNFAYSFWQQISLEHLAAIGVVQWIVWMLYYGWTYSQFFQEARKVVTWFKGVFTLLIGYMVLVFVSVGLISIILHYYKPQIEAWLAN